MARWPRLSERDILRPRVILRRMLLAGPSRRRFKTTLAVAAAVVVATLSGIRALDLRAQRAQLLAAGDRRAVNLAVVLAGYLRQTLVAVDASLRQLALHSQRIGGADAREADWRPALIAARAALPAVGSISVMDTAGIIRHSTQPVIVDNRAAITTSSGDSRPIPSTS